MLGDAPCSYTRLAGILCAMFIKFIRANKEVLFLFAIGLILRVSTSLSQIYFGLHGFTSLFPVNAWDDFHAIYAGWLHLVSQGLIPYRDFYTYTYTPLFLYALYPFYLVGGAHAASIPIIVSDAATSSVVYLIVKRLASGRMPLVAGLMYAVSPFALFYEGYLWMSSQPMTLFMLLAIYLLWSSKPGYSVFSMALAILVKQEALFILPVFGVWYATRFRRSMRRGVLIFLLTLFAVSLPFLIASPYGYLTSLNYLKPTPIPASSACTNQIVNSITVAVCGGATVGSNVLAFPVSTAATVISHTNVFPTEYILNRMSELLGPLLFLVMLPAMLVSRKALNSLGLFSTYSTVGFLTLYSLLGHPVFRYYYIPIYALLLASTTNRRTLLVSTIAPAVSLFILPSGPIQNVLPLVALLAVLAVQGEPRRNMTAAANVGLQMSR